jgi:hypothetical protein
MLKEFNCRSQTIQSLSLCSALCGGGSLSHLGEGGGGLGCIFLRSCFSFLPRIPQDSCWFLKLLRNHRNTPEFLFPPTKTTVIWRETMASESVGEATAHIIGCGERTPSTQYIAVTLTSWATRRCAGPPVIRPLQDTLHVCFGTPRGTPWPSFYCEGFCSCLFRKTRYEIKGYFCAWHPLVLFLLTTLRGPRAEIILVFVVPPWC